MQTFFKNWHVENFFFQNLTRCIFFNSKSDALWKLQIQIWRVVKKLIQNLTSFEIFLRNLIFSGFSGSDWLMITSVNGITILF